MIAVCQPSVPVLAAVVADGRGSDPLAPASMTLMGGPIDTRRNPTAVNKLADREPSNGSSERHLAGAVPQSGLHARGLSRLPAALRVHDDEPRPARDRASRAVRAPRSGDCDSGQQHRDFYEEYLSVMDLPAEFYLQTVEMVFQKQLCPRPDDASRRAGRPAAITRTALMTVEGERDDICGLGQTEAAHDLCTTSPCDEKYHYVQAGVGHYGVFNGTRWRTEI